MLVKNFKKYVLADCKLIASYEWVRDPFHKTPEGLSNDEEEKFIDFTTVAKPKDNLVINHYLNFGQE